LKPIAPLEAQEIVSPATVVIVTIVLLKVDWIWAIPIGAVSLFFLTDLFICLAIFILFY
jgi:hypothetical protein